MSVLQGRLLPLSVLLTVAMIVAAACAGGGASPTSGQVSPTTTETADGGDSVDGGDPGGDDEPFADVEVCDLASTEEVTEVMGLDAADSGDSVLGPGGSIEGAKGCYWSVGDSIDIFDLWIYPAGEKDVRSALDEFWGDGYEIEPLTGAGEEAFAVVWRGSDSIRDVGQIAGVGVRNGDKVVLLTTLLLGEPYLDPKPAADLAVKILNRF